MVEASATAPPSFGVLGTWRAVRQASDVVVSRLARDLESATGLPLEWYATLLEIYEVGGGSLAQNALQEVSGLSQSGISRMVSKMQDAGLIERAAAEHDRRSVTLNLTHKGHELLLRATPVHNEAVQRHFGRYLPSRDSDRVRSALQRVAAAQSLESESSNRLDQLVTFGESLLSISADTMVVADAIRVRDILEFPLLSDVSRHLPPSAVAPLRAGVAAMTSNIDDPDSFFRADWDLHRQLAQYCQNGVLREVYLQLLDVLSKSLARVVPTDNLPEYLNARLTIHARLIEAVIEGDLESVHAAADAHNFTSFNRKLIQVD